MIKVAILSCYRLLSVSLSQIVNASENMEIVALVDNWLSAGHGIFSGTEKVDVVLMEISRSNIDYLSLIGDFKIKSPNVKILILNSQATDVFPSQYLDAGAHGFLCRKANVDEVVFAIHEVNADKRYVSPHYLQSLGEQQLTGNLSAFSALSKRELQILLLITSGTKVCSISDSLKLSPKTVNTYRYRIFNKLGVDNDVSLARWAIRQGLMEA